MASSLADAAGPGCRALAAARLAAVTPALAVAVRGALRADGLTLPQFALLRLLRRGHRSPTQLARALGVSRPTVTRLVDGAGRRGYVVQRGGEPDRRGAEVVLTPSGAAVLTRAEERVAAALASTLRPLPRRQVQALADALAGLGAALGAPAAAEGPGG